MQQTDELARRRQLQAQCEADFKALVARYLVLTSPLARARFTTYTAMRQQTPTEGDGMPAKGYRTLGEDMENVAMRLPKSVLMEVDAHIERLHTLAPWARCGRSDALRDLVLRGLTSVTTPAVTHQESQPALPLTPVEASPLIPHETLTPQPQAPAALILETLALAPDLDTDPETGPRQPATASMVPVGMQQCSYGHSPYPMATKECPACVRNRNRRQRQPQPNLLLEADDTASVQEQPTRHGGRRSTTRQPILDLLREHPEGLTAVELKVHLRLDKTIGDTLAGMVRNGLLEKTGTGKAVRYVAR